VDGVFICVITSIDMLKTTTLLGGHGASVPSLMIGSSPAPETNDVIFDTLLYQQEGVFSTEEENFEKVSSLCSGNYKSQKQNFKSLKSEVVNLKAVLVHQQQIAT